MYFIYTGPAPEGVTNAIFEMSKSISSYKICTGVRVDLSKIGSNIFNVDNHEMVVEIIDSVHDYVSYMKELFDFGSIRRLLQGEGCAKLHILLDSMHGGKYHFPFILLIRNKFRF